MRRTVACLGAVTLALLLAATAAQARRASARAHGVTFYSVASQEQFVNNEDDRARGKGNNPFGNYKDVTAAQKEAGNGPFAGDEAIFTFKIYNTPRLTRQAGTATFVCQYDLNKNAFCETSYFVSDGTILGEGEFNFNAQRFTLTVTGGTGAYERASGVMMASPSPNHAQRLAFTLR